ncbi:MAG: phage GP46 family protein [Aquincola sp.]|nr:phage GP46 family protein [Aquincola sp.]
MVDAWINPVTADYVQSDALAPDLVQDPAQGLANAVYLRIVTPLGSWWADPALGSRLHELAREKDVARVQRLARQYCQQALQPMLDDGRLSALQIDTEREPGRLNVRVELVDAAQAPHTFNVHVKVG